MESMLERRDSPEEAMSEAAWLTTRMSRAISLVALELSTTRSLAC